MHKLYYNINSKFVLDNKYIANYLLIVYFVDFHLLIFKTTFNGNENRIALYLPHIKIPSFLIRCNFHRDNFEITCSRSGL